MANPPRIMIRKHGAVCPQVTIEVGRNNNRQMSYMGHEPVEIVSVPLA